MPSIHYCTPRMHWEACQPFLKICWSHSHALSVSSMLIIPQRDSSQQNQGHIFSSLPVRKCYWPVLNKMAQKKLQVWRSRVIFSEKRHCSWVFQTVSFLLKAPQVERHPFHYIWWKANVSTDDIYKNTPPHYCQSHMHCRQTERDAEVLVLNTQCY